MNRRMTIAQAKKLGLLKKQIPFDGVFFGRVSWPPSTNQLYANKRNGGRILTQRGRDFKKEVVIEVRRRQGRSFCDREVSLQIVGYPPDDGSRRDLDNIVKITQDGLEMAGLFDDDSQVAHLEVIKMRPDPIGFIVITVKLFDREGFKLCRSSDG